MVEERDEKMHKKVYANNDKVEFLWEPVVVEKHLSEKPDHLKMIRVAAYCRVSTELDVQTDSFELQESYYTQLICNTPGWRNAGIYIDQGISGTQRSQRMGFQRMIRHCEESKIDRILCKSISRFARNTTDLLETVRLLKKLNISVIFEKECIDTLSVQSEFLLSTIAAIAQEESRSISENMNWSFKKRFQRGIPIFRRILGYNIEGKGNERQITINKKEAAIVHEIYDLALDGKRYSTIARMMMQKNYKTAKGRSEWTLDTVKGILTNERYTGGALCQKTYTPDYLTHKYIRNNGARQQYFIENHHHEIISHEMFYLVQNTVIKNKTGKNKKNKVYPLSARVICGNCGANYHRYSSYNNGTWKCSRSIKSKNLCGTQSILESQLDSIMLKALEMRYDLKDKNIIHKLKLDIKGLQDDDNIENDRVILKRELAEALSKELYVASEDCEVAKEKRIVIEEKLKKQEQFWNLIEEDRVYRAETLEWLSKLPFGENRMNIFFKELNIEYMRAWGDRNHNSIAYFFYH